MGSPLRIRTIGGMLALSLALAAEAWGAEAPAEETLEVPEVVVGATRLPDVPLGLRNVPANVTVIAAEDIRRSGARTVQEALERVPGIVVFDQIGNRFQQSVDVRGFNSLPVPAITVYVDGVRVNEPEFNQTNFEQIPLQDVERIEVIPGPGAIYGRNALAGVINIVTKRGGEKGVAQAEVAGGSFNNKRFVGTISGPIAGGFDYYLSSTRESEDGFRDNSDGRITRTYGKIGYRREDATDLSFSYTRTDATLKQAGSLTPAELARDRTANVVPGQFGELVHLFTLNGRQRLPWGFSVSFNGFLRPRNAEAFTGFRAGGGGETKTDSSSGGGTGQIGHDLRLGPARNQITAGAEYRRDDVNQLTSAVFGLPPFAFAFQSDQSLLQDVAGFYAQDTLDLFEQVSVTAGVRYDRTFYHFIDRLTLPNTGFTRFERLTPRAGITYNPMKELGVYFNFADGFRPPTFSEILGVGPFGTNPRLLPVLTRNFEVGLRGRAGDWLEGSAAAFWARTRNDIFYIPTIGPFGANANIPATRRKGVEFSLRPRYGDTADGFITYTFTEATFATNFPQTEQRSGLVRSVQDGNLIPLVPKHRLSAGINVHPVKGLTLSMSGLYVGRSFLDQDYFNFEPKLDPYFVLNAKGTYEYRGLTFFVLGNNILNKHYETRGIFAAPIFGSPPDRFLNPAPGWSVQAGMSYRYELPFGK